MRVLMSSAIAGNALAVQEDKPFRGLQQFGTSFLQRLVRSNYSTWINQNDSFVKPFLFPFCLFLIIFICFTCNYSHSRNEVSTRWSFILMPYCFVLNLMFALFSFVDFVVIYAWTIRPITQYCVTNSYYVIT